MRLRPALLRLPIVKGMQSGDSAPIPLKVQLATGGQDAGPITISGKVDLHRQAELVDAVVTIHSDRGGWATATTQKTQNDTSDDCGPRESHLPNPPLNH